MRFWQVIPFDEAEPDQFSWHGTKADAHSYAKLLPGRRLRLDIEVREVELPTDKDSLLLLLRGGVGALLEGSSQTISRWELTPRGGIKPLMEEPDAG